MAARLKLRIVVGMAIMGIALYFRHLLAHVAGESFRTIES